MVGFCPSNLRTGFAVIATVGLAFVTPALARGPENISDVAEQVIDAVVNISTKQTVDMNSGATMPNLPPGSPFEEFFEEFFKNRRGQGGPGSGPGNGPGGGPGNPGRQGGDVAPVPRRVNSLGSGFIIDPSGLVVTNNHVIADADEVSVILNDGTTLKAEILGCGWANG
jgi:serine protease Do